MFLPLYRFATRRSAPLLERILRNRLEGGKEHPDRWQEKKAVITKSRPDGPLLWLHAASVGESVSALILIDHLLASYPSLHILVTTGTRTSAELMSKRLPERAFHQFAPLDHPEWVAGFIKHWAPNAAIWMESELWPNMLQALREAEIPTALVNARLSKKSYYMWSTAPVCAKKTLSTFKKILCQSAEDKQKFQKLRASNVIETGNIKYSAAPLPHDENEFNQLNALLSDRPVWLYASTHAGEEALALRIHDRLKNSYPDLITILVPRHPERGEEIEQLLQNSGMKIVRRTEQKHPPSADTNIYIADTLGELGLFYRLSPIAMIGRSLSDDGGGGHNPIEAAQLNCAVLHGPNVQYQTELYSAMARENAAIKVQDRTELFQTLNRLLQDDKLLSDQQKNAQRFAKERSKIIDRVLSELRDLFDEALSVGESGA